MHANNLFALLVLRSHADRDKLKLGENAVKQIFWWNINGDTNVLSIIVCYRVLLWGMGAIVFTQCSLSPHMIESLCYSPTKLLIDYKASPVTASMVILQYGYHRLTLSPALAQENVFQWVRDEAVWTDTLRCPQGVWIHPDIKQQQINP